MKHPILIMLYGRSDYLEALKNFKKFAICFGRLCSRQCKVHTSQKFTENLRYYSFYSRIWGEEISGKMVSGIRRSLFITGKSVLFSAVCIQPFDWKNNEISEDKLDRSVNEMETVEDLCNATVICPECSKRLAIDKVIADVEYCKCGGNLSYTDVTHQYDSWQPFLERENILVWRKKHENYSHLYAYKVYGKYEDMSLSAFMEVQLNSSFRTQWDTSALELKVVDSHPESNSDLLYWLVKFPQFFSNRDYVFKRRYKVNEEKKEVVILSEIVKQDCVPVEKGIHRVREYWSIMVLKAKDTFQKPGMSYTLTYFDNPGMSLPMAVTNFVATTAFPDFLKKVHRAAMSLQRDWDANHDVYVSLPPMLRHRSVDLPLVPSLEEVQEPPVQTITHDSDIAEQTERSSSIKIPLQLKKYDLDLLEAIEVVFPDLQEKSYLARKVAAMFDKSADVSNLEVTKKLHELKDKTKSFIQLSAKKKEESLRTMSEFENRRSRYDQEDEKTLLMIQGLLLSINEVLKADRDLRTGKSFYAIESPQSTTTNKVQNEVVAQIEKCNSPKVTIAAKQESKVCECCSCAVNKSWYSYTSILWGKKPPNCDECICDHKREEPPSTEPIENSKRASPSNGSQSYWSYLAFWYYFSDKDPKLQAVEVDEPCEVVLQPQAKTDSAEVHFKEDVTVSWYWIPFKGSYNFIVKVYSYWTSERVS